MNESEKDQDVISCVLYVIPGDRFIQIISKDFFMFRHFMSSAIVRYRFQHKLCDIVAKTKIKKQELKDELMQKLGLLHRCDESLSCRHEHEQPKKMLFYDLMEYVGKKFEDGTATVQQYFAEIQDQRIKNNEKRMRRKIILRELVAGNKLLENILI